MLCFFLKMKLSLLTQDPFRSNYYEVNYTNYDSITKYC